MYTIQRDCQVCVTVRGRERGTTFYESQMDGGCQCGGRRPCPYLDKGRRNPEILRVRIPRHEEGVHGWERKWVGPSGPPHTPLTTMDRPRPHPQGHLSRLVVVVPREYVVVTEEWTGSRSVRTDLPILLTPR